MADYNTRAAVTLNINGSQARQVLATMQKEADRLKAAMDRAARMGDKEALRQATQEYNRVRRTIDQIRGSAATAEQVLTRLDRATPRELRKSLTELRRQLNGIERGSEAWDAHIDKIRRVQAELDAVNRQMRTQTEGTSRFRRILESAGGAMLGGLGAGSVEAIISGGMNVMRSSVDAYASVQEEMSGVSKYSGLAADDVAALNEEFRKMDTRTSIEDLNRLAQDAGRLGKTSVDDILGFVRAADQINVALDDLGDGATLTLSKLTDIFGIEAEFGTEQALLKAGSVINELSQSCSASAPYIAEFAARMGSVGKAAGMSMQDVMAFGALLDSQGVNVEAAATALQQLTVRMITDPAKYAQAAGIEVEKFTELVKTNMTEAMFLFLDTLNSKGGMDTLGPMFADMGEKGSNAVKVLSTLAGQVDALRARQQEANDAFRDGVSVSNEAATANSTVAAELDKARKRTAELSAALGEKLWPIMTAGIKTSGALISVLSTLLDFVGRQWRAIVAATVVLVAYTACVKADTIAHVAHNAVLAVKNGLMKAGQLLQAAMTAGYHLASAGLMALTGNTAGATAAMAGFNAVCAANPIGAVAAAIGAGVAAFSMFDSAAESSARKTDALASATENATLRREEETAALEENIRQLDGFNGSKEEEERLVGELNNKYGKFFGRYKDLSKWLEVLKKRGQEYIDVVYEQILAEGKLEAARQMIAEAARKREESKHYDPAWYEKLVYGLSDENLMNLLQFRSDATGIARREGSARLNREADALEAQAKELMEEGKKGAAAAREKERNARGVFPYRNADERDAAEAEMARNNTSAMQVSDTSAAGEADGKAGKTGKPRTSSALTEQEREERRNAAEQEKADARKLKEDLARIKLEQKAELQQIELDFYRPGADVYQDEEKKQVELHNIRLKYLRQEQALYAEDSEEYGRLEKQIEEENGAEKLRIYQKWEKLIGTYSEDYRRLSAKRRLEEETATLEAIHKAGIISEEDYRKTLKAIREKYADETVEGSSGTAAAPSGESPKEQYEREMADLEAWYKENEDMTEEYARRRAAIEKKYWKAATQMAREAGGEYAEMVVNIYNAFKALFENSAEDGRSWLEKTQDVATAVFAVMSAGTQAFSQYYQASQDLELAKVEKRYERQRELAEGNSYREKKAEEQLEAEKARIKKEAAEKNFAAQVAMAVGQTAVNAIMAYGSAQNFPFPMSMILGAVAAAAAVAAGAVQIATLKKQKDAAVAGYSEGGFTKPGGVLEPAGIVHAGEWVASQRLVNNPRTRPIIDMLEQAQRTNTIGMISGADVSRTIMAPVVAASRPAAVPSPRTESPKRARRVRTEDRLEDALGSLTRRLREPFVTVATVTGDKGINRAQDEYSRLLRNKRPKTRKND